VKRFLAGILGIILCVGGFIVGGLFAADPQTNAAPAKPSPTKTAPAGAGVSADQDKQIEAAIRVKLAKSKIGQDGLKVRVQGGVAYWDGSTAVLQHKGAATRMAKSAGARLVVNNIKVGDAAKQKAADNLTQGPRPAQLKRSEPRTQQ
jgi:hypothetical protein